MTVRELHDLIAEFPPDLEVRWMNHEISGNVVTTVYLDREFNVVGLS